MTITAKYAIITIDTDVSCPGQGICYLAAGTYRIEMPDDYDPALVTGTDIVCDDQIIIVEAL